MMTDVRFHVRQLWHTSGQVCPFIIVDINYTRFSHVNIEQRPLIKIGKNIAFLS